jgi:poly-gamma-glutamate synthesis protein (capsule biosynthesis protein)
MLALLCWGSVAIAGTPGDDRPKPSVPSIVLIGDVLLAGSAGRLIASEGPSAPFARVSDVLQRADLAIANLECPLATSGEPADKQFTFRARPDAAAALASAGIDLVTLANNHSVDYGPQALLETLDALRKHDVRFVGAGRDLAEAGRPAVFECGSPAVKIAVLAFSNMLPTSFYAAEDSPGTNPAWPALVRHGVKAGRREADIVIVHFHWGPERDSSPSPVQRRLARTAAEAGADLVVGHHPHVLQGFEVLGRSVIAYSLGNFLFPSREECRRTMMLRYTPDPAGSARVEILPCVIEGFQPRPASEDECTEIISHMRDLSRDLGCGLIDDDGALVVP